MEATRRNPNQPLPMGSPEWHEVPGKDENMAKKLAANNVKVSGDVVTFDAHIHGGIKESEARPRWQYGDVDILLTGVEVSMTSLLEGYMASGRFWIKIQGWLRKCPQAVVEGFIGVSMSWTAFKAAVSAALPEGGEKAELRSELERKDAYIAKLREQLRKSGLTDAQIDAALAE